MDDHGRDGRIQMRQTLRGVVTVRDREIGHDTTREPLGPVAAAHHVMRPEDERDARARGDSTEYPERPWRMAHDATDAANPNDACQRATSSSHTVRSARAYGGEPVDARARRVEILAQAPFEGEREVVRDLWDSPLPSRNRHENRLYPAEEIPAVNVEDAHYEPPSAC